MWCSNGLSQSLRYCYQRLLYSLTELTNAGLRAMSPALLLASGVGGWVTKMQAARAAVLSTSTLALTHALTLRGYPLTPDLALAL